MHADAYRFVNYVKTVLTPEHFTNSNVIECGSLNINGTVRDLFEDCTYTGVDLAPGPCVDRIGRFHEVWSEQRDSEAYDVAICTEALEHDAYMSETVSCLCRSVRPGGIVVITAAGPQREEHGTVRRRPWDSPYTVDFYRNVTMGDLALALERSGVRFLQWEMVCTADGGADIYFWGLRA